MRQVIADCGEICGGSRKACGQRPKNTWEIRPMRIPPSPPLLRRSSVLRDGKRAADAERSSLSRPAACRMSGAPRHAPSRRIRAPRASKVAPLRHDLADSAAPRAGDVLARVPEVPAGALPPPSAGAHPKGMKLPECRGLQCAGSEGGVLARQLVGNRVGRVAARSENLHAAARKVHLSPLLGRHARVGRTKDKADGPRDLGAAAPAQRPRLRRGRPRPFHPSCSR